MLPVLLVTPPSFGVGSDSVAYCRLTPMDRCEMLLAGLVRAARMLERRAADLENILAE